MKTKKIRCPKWEYFESVLNHTITFSYEEIMELCNVYVRNAGLHLCELAVIFTRYFPARREPYTLREIFGIFNKELKFQWLFQRSGLCYESAQMLQGIMNEYSSIQNKGICVRAKSTPMVVDPAFQQSLLAHLYEFDIIPVFINSFLCLLADVAINLSVKCYETFEDFPVEPEIEQTGREDIEFFFTAYKSAMGNKRRFGDLVKDRYKSVKRFKTPDREKIANIYLTEGAGLPVVKDCIIRFYLEFFDNKFPAWNDIGKDGVVPFCLIFGPKVNNFLCTIGLGNVKNEKETLNQLVNWIFYKIYKQRKTLLDWRQKEKDAKVTQNSRQTILCDKDNCEGFHKRLEDISVKNAPGMRSLIDKCNSHRGKNLDSLRSYFALGSFDKQSPFAKFLKVNLSLFAAVDKIFEDQDLFRQFCGVYHQGILRSFWTDKNLQLMKQDYDYLYEDIKKEGLSNMFLQQKGIARIKFKSLDEYGWWVVELLDSKYKPRHSSKNYDQIMNILFGKRTDIKIGEKTVSVHVIFFLMMFYYWLYVSIKKDTSKDVCSCSRCVFHREIVVNSSFA